jgi:glycerophosphoryl diester phosphodiesterase
VIAHRGSSFETAEHTSAAYEQALAEGADGLECDVRLTADGHLVCVHDRRVERTSDGTGVVSTLRLDDLAALDFGAGKATHRTPYPAQHTDRSKLGILTLRELIELTLEAGRPVELAIETKHPVRYAGYVEQRLVALLDRYGLAHPRLGSTSPVRIMSFSVLALRRIRRLAPSLRTVLLLDRWPVRFRDGSLPTGVGIAGPGIEVLREFPSLARRFREQGHEVHVWTVNRDVDLDLCLELDVDVVITDRPAHVLGRLGRAPLRPPAAGGRRRT